VFTIDEARRCAQMYLGGHPPDDPIVDPISADLSGLPPMLIQAATGDARLADAKALAANARAHGVDVRLELFPLDAHAFHLFWSFLPRPRTRSRRPARSSEPRAAHQKPTAAGAQEQPAA
jgi:monoterpene epsilon-lactone hydrolase